MDSFMESYSEYIKGRGAQINPHNRFKKHSLDTEPQDGLDEPYLPKKETQIFLDHPKKIINKVTSPDVPLDYSLNPYQGCEHGCTYCYARNAHEFWGFSAGIDFESKIIVKENAPKLLRKELKNPKWEVKPIMFSGNTDCYQPLERKFQLTRKCLEICLEFKHPLSIVTKNALILRDIDILTKLAQQDLVHVHLTVTTLDEELRRLMEPRTSSGMKRMQTVRKLNEAGIPTGVLLGPIIPGLNNHELAQLMEKAYEAGALSTAYTYVRLNGAVGKIFENWIRKNLPDRAKKVLHQIKEAHGGNLNDSQYGRRMRGEGPIAEGVNRLFKILKSKYFSDRQFPPYNCKSFQLPPEGQLRLF
ncbi:MAG: PA0069 family radical SAM protein [Bacteroidia bacterium]|nr:PA0069 family radical SAM protein [Bacteroidia bacterium]